MPIWLIEIFGSKDLNSTFILILLMTAPVWIAIIAMPHFKLVRSFAQPLILPPIYCFVLCILLWKSYETSLLPDPLAAASYDAAKEFARHPVAFLALFCNLQILNLFVGTWIYQRANRAGFDVPVELFLCWLLGALALLPFCLRLLLKQKSLR